MSANDWTPQEVPLDRPSAARVYDYLLGGFHNFENDRMVAEQLAEVYPEIKLAAQVNRGFLRRAVRFLVGQGIEQFLDIGSGIPTVGNVHEVAQSINPATRVVYVDKDPVAVAHSQAILVDNPHATAIKADLCEPEKILGHPEVRNLLDLDRPVGLIMVAVLHYVLDDELAYRSVRTYYDSLAVGSHLAVAHTVQESQFGEVDEELNTAFRAASDTRVRSWREIERFFDGWQLVEPGLVFTPLWRPDGPDDPFFDDPSGGFTLSGVGIKL
jgi:hypothetical protein